MAQADTLEKVLLYMMRISTSTSARGLSQLSILAAVIVFPAGLARADFAISGDVFISAGTNSTTWGSVVLVDSQVTQDRIVPGDLVIITPVPTGTACVDNEICASGLCVDEVCCGSECADECGACNLPGTVGTCSPVAEGSLECRPADPDDLCDLPEQCDGISMDCPIDEHKAAGAECRSSRGPCDAPEACVYNDDIQGCPPDVPYTRAGEICRPQLGSCDLPERCGWEFQDACPPDGFVPAGTLCGLSYGLSDLPGVYYPPGTTSGTGLCSGGAPSCPGVTDSCSEFDSN